MPPWLPEHGYGDFANERRLTDDQIAIIQRWVDQGAVEGAPADKPPIPAWPQGWQLGQPDLVLNMADAYTLPAGEADVFRNFVFQVPLPSTRYVRAIEFRTDSSRVLHHASVAVDPARMSRKLDRADPEPGFASMPDDQVQNVFGWSPGKAPFMEPADRAWTLAKGSDLVVQMHMLPGGTPEVIRPAIGLFFTDTAPTRTPIVDRPSVEDDRHPRRRPALRHRRPLRAAGGRRGRQRLSARALSGHRDDRQRDASRWQREAADLDQGLGLQLAGSICVRVAAVASERHHPEHAVYLRQLGPESEPPASAGAARRRGDRNRRTRWARSGSRSCPATPRTAACS